MRRSIIPIFLAHKGCPHQCVFCDQTAIAGESVSPEDVCACIEDGLIKCAPAVPQVAFYGGSFTALPQEEQEAYLATVQPYITNGQVSEIRLSTRPDAISDAILLRLKAAGVCEIELGAQSMDDSVLKAAGRGHSAEDTRCAARKVKEAGFSLVLQMMVGLPGETDPCKTAHELIKLAPDAVRIYPVAVVRGTPLETLWKQGRYQPLELSRGVEICALLADLFEQNGISIIRMGLNPSAELDAAVCAGVYHPAFGELVQSRRYYQKARALLEREHGEVTLLVHPRRLSCMIGHKKENLLRLQKEFGLTIHAKAGKVRENEIKIVRAPR